MIKARIIIIACFICLLLGDVYAIEFKYGGIVRPILNILPTSSRGLIVSIIGEVRIKKVEEQQYVEANKCVYVNFYDVIELGPNALIELAFEDNSSTILGPFNTIKWVALKPLQDLP